MGSCLGCVLQLNILAMVFNSVRAEAPFPTLEKTLPAGNVARLVIDTSLGSISVAGAPGAEIKVEVLHGVLTEDANVAHKSEDALQVTISDVAGELRILGRLHPRVSGSARSRLEKKCQFRVLVPPTLALKIVNGPGDVTVDGMQGESEVTIGRGDMKICRQGGWFRGTIGSGNVEADHLSGGGAFNCGNGSIKVGATAGWLEAIVGNGTISVGAASGGVKLETGKGRIAVSYTGNPEGSSSINAGFGGITVGLAASAKTWVDVKCPFGRIKCDETLGGERKKSLASLQLRLNGGGSSISISCGFGGVSLVRSDTTPDQPSQGR